MAFFTCYTLSLKECSPREFLQRWAPLYQEGPVPDKVLEENLLIGRTLEAQNILPLVNWRRQGSMEEKDQEVIACVTKSLKEINAFRSLSKTSEEEVLNFYEKVDAWAPDNLILRVFILHMARPQQFPLFDQNIHLAHQILTQSTLKQPEPILPDDDPAYFTYMKTFFQMVTAGAKPVRTLYQALSAFGQFLSMYKQVFVF